MAFNPSTPSKKQVQVLVRHLQLHTGRRQRIVLCTMQGAAAPCLGGDRDDCKIAIPKLGMQLADTPPRRQGLTLRLGSMHAILCRQGSTHLPTGSCKYCTS